MSVSYHGAGAKCSGVKPAKYQVASGTTEENLGEAKHKVGLRAFDDNVTTDSSDSI